MSCCWLLCSPFTCLSNYGATGEFCILLTSPALSQWKSGYIGKKAVMELNCQIRKTQKWLKILKNKSARKSTSSSFTSERDGVVCCEWKLRDPNVCFSTKIGCQARNWDEKTERSNNRLKFVNLSRPNDAEDANRWEKNVHNDKKNMNNKMNNIWIMDLIKSPLNYSLICWEKKALKKWVNYFVNSKKTFFE